MSDVTELLKELERKAAAAAGVVLLATGDFPITEVTKLEDGRLKFKGIALHDNCLSHNRRFYSEAANTRIMERTNEWQAKGNVITAYSRHGKAIGGFFSLPTGIPIGKIEGPLFREGSKICYWQVISATAEGKDVQVLIHDDVMKPTSIRAYEFETKPMKMRLGDEEKDVLAVQTAIIAGIDHCERPGISGAGIVKVLEGAPELFEVPVERQEGDDMDWNDITYEELKAHRPELLNEHLAESIGPLIAEKVQFATRITELEGREPVQDPALVTAKQEAEAEVEVFKGSLAEAEAELALYVACATPGVKGLVAELTKNPPEEGELAERIEEISADPAFIASIVGDADGHGNAHPGLEIDLGDPDYAAAIKDVAPEALEAMEDILELAAPRALGAIPEEFVKPE